jgi:hypothetical protein
MKLYIYNHENMEVVAIAKGIDNQTCESKAESAGYVGDDYAWTYTPAFGYANGLVENLAAEVI